MYKQNVQFKHTSDYIDIYSICICFCLYLVVYKIPICAGLMYIFVCSVLVCAWEECGTALRTTAQVSFYAFFFLEQNGD